MKSRRKRIEVESNHNPPTELVKRDWQLVEVPLSDTRKRSQVIADLKSEVDQYERSVIDNFSEKIREYAKALKELIDLEVK